MPSAPTLDVVETLPPTGISTPMSAPIVMPNRKRCSRPNRGEMNVVFTCIVAEPVTSFSVTDPLASSHCCPTPTPRKNMPRKGYTRTDASHIFCDTVMPFPLDSVNDGKPPTSKLAPRRFLYLKTRSPEIGDGNPAPISAPR